MKLVEVVLKQFKLIIVGLIIMTNLMASSGYNIPPEDITKIFEAPALPYYSFVPFQSKGLEITYQAKQDLQPGR